MITHFYYESCVQSDQSLGGLKAELRTILPELNEMRSRKSDRKKQFIEVTKQIQKIRDEIFRPSGCSSTTVVVDESDLSLRKLEELHAELQALQKEKVSIMLHPIQLFQIPTPPDQMK